MIQEGTKKQPVAQTNNTFHNRKLSFNSHWYFKSNNGSSDLIQSLAASEHQTQASRNNVPREWSHKLKKKRVNFCLQQLKISTLVQTIEVKGLTIPETPPNNKGLLPILSTTTTATPVIINYNNKITCQDYLVETVAKSPFGKDFVNQAEGSNGNNCIWYRNKNDKQKQEVSVQ